MTVPAIIASSVLGLLTVIAGLVWGKSRESISGAREITESALLLVEPQSVRILELTAAVEKLAGQVSQLNTKIVQLELHITDLSKQLIELGHTPVIAEA
tara:strand:+ start:568 stop:864 length:297 start_codon:yes stop_codon:yes gene_type:complete